MLSIHGESLVFENFQQALMIVDIHQFNERHNSHQQTKLTTIIMAVVTNVDKPQIIFSTHPLFNFFYNLHHTNPMQMN